MRLLREVADRVPLVFVDNPSVYVHVGGALVLAHGAPLEIGSGHELLRDVLARMELRCH